MDLDPLAILRLLELALFWLIAVYMLYSVSKYLKFQKRDFRTAFIVGMVGLIAGVVIFSLFSGSGLRAIGAIFYVSLIKFFYKCGWRTSFCPDNYNCSTDYLFDRNSARDLIVIDLRVENFIKWKLLIRTFYHK